jgi:hypothetical protein
MLRHFWREAFSAVIVFTVVANTVASCVSRAAAVVGPTIGSIAPNRKAVEPGAFAGWR